MPVSGSGPRPMYHLTKRFFDLVIAVSALVVLAPLFAVIGILIKLDSPGPVFFTQERVGARRMTELGRTVWVTRTFRVIKFRSMRANADESIHRKHIQAFVRGDINDSSFKLVDDQRITRVGRVLRKTSLDELPQLINVVKGEMSLVGPRPVPTYEVAQYQGWHRERLAALPGLTGLWQVEGRSQVTFEEMVQMDIDYVRQASLALDAKILVMTIPAVLSGGGAA